MTHPLWVSYLITTAIALLAFAPLFLVPVDSGPLLVTSTYTQQIKIGGQLTTQQVATVACNDLNDHGIISTDTSEVEITCNAPELFFSVQEISAAPLWMGTGLARACEVGDLDQYIDSAKITGQLNSGVVSMSQDSTPGLTTGYLSNYTLGHSAIKSRAQRFTNRHLAVTKQQTHNSAVHYIIGNQPGSVKRRLLQLDPIALGIAITALVEVEQLKGKVQAVENIANANTVRLNQVAGQITDLTTTTGYLVKNLTLQNDINNSTASALLSLKQGTANNSRDISSLTDAMKQFQLNVTDTVNGVVNDTKRSLDALQASLQNTSQEVYAQINNLLQLTYNLSKGQVDLATHFGLDIAANGRMQRNSLSQTWDASQGVSLDRLLTASLYLSAQNIPDGAFILNTDEGTPPHEGLLTGVYSRFFIERVIINWVQVTDINTQTGRIAYREDITYWMDTMFGIVNDKPWNTWDDTMGSLGPSNCVRPTTDADFPYDSIDLAAINSPTAPGCVVYVETVKTLCEVNHAMPNYTFDLTTSGSLDYSICQPGSTYPTTPTRLVHRSLSSFNQHIGDLYANDFVAHNAPTFKVFLQRIGGQTVIPVPVQKSHAYLPFNTAPDTIGYSPLQSYVNNAIVLAFPKIQIDLQNREQLIFGRPFDGTDETPSPIAHTPTIRALDPDTNQIQIQYDGGAKRTKCKQLEYRYVSTSAVGLNVAQPLTNRLINLNITVNTVTRTGDPTAIPVTTSDIQQSVVYNTEIHQPSQFSFFGSLDPYVYGGVTWDVPEDVICKVNEYNTCKNKVGSFRITSSDAIKQRLVPTLAAWMAEYPSMRIYHPRDMGASLSFFARFFILDDEGYPQCNVAGGISASDLELHSLNSTAKPGCHGSFDWFEGTVANQETNIVCNTLVDQGELWYTDNTPFGISNTSASTISLLNPWGFSFVYDSNRADFIIMTLVTIDSKLVIHGGASIIINSNNGASVVTIPVQHDTDDSNHHVWIQWDPATSRLVVYVDLLLVYSAPGFTITATSGLGTPFARVYPNDGSTPGAANTIFSLRYYNTYYSGSTLSNIRTFGSCHYSKAPVNRCDQPLTISNGPLTADRILVNAYQIPASTCLPGSSVLLTDPLNTVGVVFPGSGSQDWTFSWMSDRTPLSASVFTPVATIGGQNILVTTTQVKFVLASNTGTVQTTTFPSLTLDSTHAHFFTLVSSSTDSTPLRFYIDKIEVPSSGSNYPVLIAVSGSVASSIFLNPGFTMGRYYDGTALSQGGIVTAYNCEVSSTVLGSTSSDKWRTPYATCITSQHSQHSAYCRHSSLCNGRCSVYTTDLDQASDTYSIAAVQCDPGYEGATCQSVCPRHTDKLYCLSDTDIYKPLTNTTNFGAVPGSEFCNILAHFKVRELPTQSNGQRIVSAKYRKWSQWPTIVVPQGNLVSTIATGECPVVTPTAVNTSSLAFRLQNNADVDTTVRVQWISVSTGPDAEDCAALYSLGDAGYQISIQAHYSRYFLSPPCGTTQIQIQRLVAVNTWEDCGGPITSDVFPEIFATSIIVPESFTAALVIQQSSTFIAMNNQARQSSVQNAQLLQYVMQAQHVGQELQDAIAAYQAHVNQTESNNTPLDFDAFLQTRPQVGGPTFDEILKAAAASAAATGQAAADHSDIDRINALNAQLRTALVNMGIDLDNQVANQTASLKAFNDQMAVLRAAADKLNSGADIFTAFGNGAVHLAGSILGLPAMLAGGIFGGLGAGIGSLFEGIIPFLLYGGIALAVYFCVIKPYMARKAASKYSEFSGEVTSPPPVHTSANATGRKESTNLLIHEEPVSPSHPLAKMRLWK